MLVFLITSAQYLSIDILPSCIVQVDLSNLVLRNKTSSNSITAPFILHVVLLKFITSLVCLPCS